MDRLLENRDWRYYRDKYLALVTIFSLVIALADLFSDWPPDHDSLKSGLRLLAVAAVALLFSSQRLATIGGAVGFVGLRIFIGMFLYHFPPMLGAGIIGVCVLILLLLVMRNYRLPYRIGRYTAVELGIDSLVFCGMLWTMIKIKLI
jgi:hypothetical protein